MKHKDEDIFIKRMIELSRISFERNICTYSDFLNLNQLNLLDQMQKNKLYSPFELNGGYKLAQRQMITFIPDAVSCNMEYPISTLSIKMKSKKYSDILTHRDYLGSILGLGIDRSMVGDILIFDNYTLVFVHSKIADFICQHLDKVKHTMITCDYYYDLLENFEPKYDIIQGSVSSIRLDSIMALVVKESRSKLIRHIELGKVFVNSKLITSNGYKLNNGDIISIRGLGKFQYSGTINTTKKGKLFVEVRKYM